MSFCENCGHEVSAATKFCSNCGKEIISIRKKDQQESIKASDYPIGSDEINVEKIWWVRILKRLYRETAIFVLSVFAGIPLSYLFQPSIIRDNYTIHYYIAEWFRAFKDDSIPFEEITNSWDDLEIYFYTLLLTPIILWVILSILDMVIEKIRIKS